MVYTQMVVRQLREWADLIEGLNLEEFYGMEFSTQTGSSKAFQQLRKGLLLKGVYLDHGIDNIETRPYEYLESGGNSGPLRVRFTYLGEPDHED